MVLILWHLLFAWGSTSQEYVGASTHCLPARFLNYTREFSPCHSSALVSLDDILGKALERYRVIELHCILDIIVVVRWCDLECGHIVCLHVVILLHLRVSEHTLQQWGCVLPPAIAAHRWHFIAPWFSRALASPSTGGNGSLAVVNWDSSLVRDDLLFRMIYDPRCDLSID